MPEVVETEARDYACVRRKVPVTEVGKIMGPSVQAVGAELKAQGIAPAGPWFTHHYVRPREFFDVEICFPVERPIAPAGEVQAGVWPAMRVARTVYQGNYSGLPGAWGELERWMKAEGLTGGGEFWEEYVVNPNDDPNPENWRTQLNWPVV